MAFLVVEIVNQRLLIKYAEIIEKRPFLEGPPNLKGIKYFDLFFCHGHLLTKPNICADFERNRWFELYHSLPGFLMDKLSGGLKQFSVFLRIKELGAIFQAWNFTALNGCAIF